MNTFEITVDHFLQKTPCEDAVSAKKALMMLYSLMAAEASRDGENPETWWRVQQLQTSSPLRFFWYSLAKDESRIIRAAAKGNICEAIGEYCDDPEVSTMTAKNLQTMHRLMNSSSPVEENEGLRVYAGLPEAQELWVTAGFGRFAPELRIREL